MSRTHITKHAYEDMMEELYPSVRKQYKRRMLIAYVVLILSILFTLYIFTVGECKRIPVVGSIAERQSAMLTQDISLEKEESQRKGEGRDAKRISKHEYGGLSLAGQ